MNIKSNRNASKNIWYFLDLNNKRQNMNFSNNWLKDIKQVLIEWRLWKKNMIEECKLYKNKNDTVC